MSERVRMHMGVTGVKGGPELPAHIILTRRDDYSTVVIRFRSRADAFSALAHNERVRAFLTIEECGFSSLPVYLADPAPDNTVVDLRAIDDHIVGLCKQ